MVQKMSNPIPEKLDSLRVPSIKLRKKNSELVMLS
jgi:hypothetical protein